MATARHYGQRLDQDVSLASRIFATARLVLKDIAPAYEQNASRGATQAAESYNEMKGDIVDVHDRGQAHAKRLGDVASIMGL